MSILLILLLVAAVICFACAAVGVVSKFNLTAAGLFFWALTQLLPLLLRLGCVALACALLSGCAFDSVGVGATYADQNGATYGANANFHLKDDAKAVKPINAWWSGWRKMTRAERNAR